MKVDDICNTRPWKIFVEGPSQYNANSIKPQGFNEGKTIDSPKDIRFTTKDDNLFVIVMGWPEDGKVIIKSLSTDNPLCPKSVKRVELLGSGKLKFEPGHNGLTVILPLKKSGDIALVLKIKGEDL